MTSAHDNEAEASDPSYIDYDLFLDPSFSASSFANTLVLSTNNPTDTPLDLATPLSRVLFDIQEVDSHIHALTSKSALPLLTHTQQQNDSSSRIVTELSSQVGSLNDSYKRLEKEITGRYEAAEEVRQVSERLWHTVRLARAVGRALQLGRQLEVQMTELQPPNGAGAKPREDHRAMIRASNTITSLRTLFNDDQPGGEGDGLSRVNTISTLNSAVLNSSERAVRSRAQQIIREFSMSTLSNQSATYAQTEDTKSRTTSALLALYILSPPISTTKGRGPHQEAELMINSLHDYLRTSLTSSLASLTRALGTLPTLDRTLLEVAARCQNIVALELLLDSIKAPYAATKSQAHSSAQSLLQPLLSSLETGSLPSYFWRTLAGSLSPKVSELMNKGGVQARTLRSKREVVREGIRECVIKGSQVPQGAVIAGRKKEIGWEREVGVMIGSVVGHLGR